MESIFSILHRLSQTNSVIQAAFEEDANFKGEATVILVEPPKERPYWLGRVAFKHSYWKAKTLSPALLKEGDICEVIGISNITLIIKPLK